MRHENLTAARFAAATSVFVLAACGGGGGGGAPATTVISSSSGTSTTGTTTASPNTTFGSGSPDTNNFGTAESLPIATTPGSVPISMQPAAATTGANSAPTPLPGTQPLGGTAFPLKQSVISATSSGIVPDTAANAGGATLSVINWNASGDSQFRLTIPSLGVDTTFTSATLLKGRANVLDSTFRLTSSNLNYTALGVWEVITPGNVHLSAFTTGYETPVAGVPTSGTAIYFGTSNVAGLVTTYPSSGGIARASLLGDASLSANFGTGAITGNFTNVIATSGAGVSNPWNNVSVSASITATTSHFSGSTAAASAPATPFALSGAATGRIDGGLYGPNANELGAVWSLTDSGNVAIGIVGGRR